MSIYIPLFQTLVWPILIAGLVFFFRGSFATMLDAATTNLRKGASVVVGPTGVSIGNPPAEIKNTGQAVGVTAEGTKGVERTKSIEETLRSKNLPQGVLESPYLVHASQIIRPRTDAIAGLYRVHVSLESDAADQLRTVKRVTYRLHSTFPNRVIATEARDKNFELWMNVYGEFTIVAVVEREGQESLWLTRYLDLPGRPPE